MAKKNDEIENNDAEVSLVLTVPRVEAILPKDQEEKIAAEMALYSKKYEGFQIKSKKDYEDLKTDLKAVRDKRILVDGKDGWRVQVKRLADTVSSTLLSYFEPVEAQLNAIKKTYDDAEAERIRLEKEAREKLIKDRTNAIYAVGGVFNGSAYVVGDAEIYPEDLPTDVFEAKLEAMKAERIRLDEAERVRKLEAERLAREEQERQRLAKEKADADAREIAELKAKLKKQEEEAARVEAENKAKTEAIRNDELRGYLVFIRDYNKMLALPEDEYQKELAQIKEAARLQREHDAKEIQTLERKSETVETAEPPFTINTPSGKVVEVPRDLLAVDVPQVTPAVDAPATESVTEPKTSILPTDARDREIFLSGAKAAFGMAKREFPDITPAQWRDCWKRFQEL